MFALSMLAVGCGEGGPSTTYGNNMAFNEGYLYCLIGKKKAGQGSPECNSFEYGQAYYMAASKSELVDFNWDQFVYHPVFKIKQNEMYWSGDKFPVVKIENAFKEVTSSSGVVLVEATGELQSIAQVAYREVLKSKPQKLPKNQPSFVDVALCSVPKDGRTTQESSCSGDNPTVFFFSSTGLNASVTLDQNIERIEYRIGSEWKSNNDKVTFSGQEFDKGTGKKLLSHSSGYLVRYSGNLEKVADKYYREIAYPSLAAQDTFDQYMKD